MKKLSILVLVILFTVITAEARDFAELQIKEMKHAQKYSTTKKYLENDAAKKANSDKPVLTGIKDPKIMKFSDFEKINSTAYNTKIQKDNTKYAQIEKSLGKRTIDNYNAAAKGENYYKLYRIAEKIIRANNLDYLNWRIGYYRDTDNPNAYSTNNLVNISSSLYDTFKDNDDALAMIIGHELGHALLGHQQRSAKIIAKMQRNAREAKAGDAAAALAYDVLKRKYLIDSKNMEYAADVEGAKLMLKAGYNLDKGLNVISYINTLPQDVEYFSDHPSSENRIKNLNDNRRYFIEPEWKEMGKYNIYNSEVLNVSLSSDRKSIVISGTPDRLDPEGYYRPETIAQVYERFGYKAYTNGEFKKSLEYFDKLFKVDETNAAAYLYASYASEALYKHTDKPKMLEKAKNYAQRAKQLDPSNKYVLEQIEAL